MTVTEVTADQMPAGTSQMTDDFFYEHQGTAHRLARGAHRGSSLFAVEDIEQAIWEHVATNWKYYVKGDEGYIDACMARAANAYVRQERVDFMYFTGSFVYTPKITRGYLETCAWQPIEEVPDLDARVDLQEAFAKLRLSAPKQAAAVFKRYGLGETELSGAEKFNLSAGVEAICHRLNSGLRLQAESIELAISKEH